VSIYPPISTPGMATLGRQLGIDPAILMRSATEVPGRLARPPFHAVPIRPGITVTCEGVAIDTRARVLDTAGQPMPGLFAAGMAVAPSILGTGYLAGMGMTMGAVTGRLAGEEAARHVGH
jgi:tricarballylate dehydrogenase